MATPLVTQTELVEGISDQTGFSKGEVKNFLNALETVITENVAEGYRVKVCGIQVEAKLKKARKARMGRNPATGEEVKISAKPASVKLTAKIVKPLKDAKLPSTKKLASLS